MTSVPQRASDVDHQQRIQAAHPQPSPSGQPETPPQTSGLLHARSGGDRCPGALRLHEAADGALARVRVPGGLLTSAQVLALCQASEDLADGQLRITARGNIELRGIDPTAAANLAAQLRAAALLPSNSHERMRNIVASPLAGVDGHGGLPCGDTTMVTLVRALDQHIINEPCLAGLAGRFLFGLDDGRADIYALDPDIAATLLPDGKHWSITLGGNVIGVVETEQVCADVTNTAVAYLRAEAQLGTTVWRVRELGPIQDQLVAEAAAQVRAAGGPAMSAPDAAPTARPGSALGAEQPPSAGEPTPGLIYADEEPVAICLGLPLGTAPTAAWRALAAIAATGDGLVRTTPWRSVIINGLDAKQASAGLETAHELGLITAPEQPLAAVSACTGLPGCARSAADVRAQAIATATASQSLPNHTAGPAGSPAGSPTRVHWSGCSRRCGRPTGAHIQVIASDEGYSSALVHGANGGHQAYDARLLQPDSLAADIAARRTQGALR